MCSLVLAGELRHLLVEHADMRMRPIMIVHIGSGMALLVVMLMRSALRAGRAKPIGATTLQQWCAHIVHPAMYVFVLGECLAGWVIVNAKGMVIPMPGTGWDFPVWWTPTRNWSATWSGPRMAGLPALRPAGRAHRRRAVASLGRQDGTLGHMGRPGWRLARRGQRLQNAS